MIAMSDIMLDVTGTLKGPQIPVVHTFDTRVDIFINRYGVMYDAKCNELVSLEQFSNNVLVFVYCMARPSGNKQCIQEVLTIQQISAIKRIMSSLSINEILYGPGLKNVSPWTA